MPYVLDANVFIQAKNLHYGFDFCPAFWDWLILSNRTGLVFSVEKVADELLVGDDELVEWTKSRGPDFFLPLDPAVIEALPRVSSWVMAAGYEPAAVNTFFQVADYYLVAHALAYGFAIVTHEVPAATRKKVKIPNVCVGLGISYLSPFEMLRREKARFVLEQTSVRQS